VIVGSATATTINGGAGNDTITGGAAADSIGGGAGNDVNIFTHTKSLTKWH
jgi:Ca2+-binding RTX toxin-like protein